VKWFGRIFSGAGVSADPDKITHMVQADKPKTIEDVRSLLQAAACNAKYGFDHKEDQTYEEVNTPPSASCSPRTPSSGGTRRVTPASRP
jgi:hypothetical protein